MATLTLLGACSKKDGPPDLMAFRQTEKGPEEFLVLPAKPLQTPSSTDTLPIPTPGGTNRADATPVADAIAALGGNPDALNREGIPQSDAALVAATGRAGRDPAIRETLYAEDVDYRRANNRKLAERWANTNVYFRSYKKQSLDQQAEQARLRAAGLPVPAAPPVEIKPE
ncbi:MAG: DUF3035 domain-containing protein [Mangrovicoccus sp.]